MTDKFKPAGVWGIRNSDGSVSSLFIHRTKREMIELYRRIMKLSKSHRIEAVRLYKKVKQ